MCNEEFQVVEKVVREDSRGFNTRKSGINEFTCGNMKNNAMSPYL